MNKTYLRLEIYSDNARARFLKRLARGKRTNSSMREDAQFFLSDTRKELRSKHLALGFLRGRTHAQMERPLRPANRGHMASTGQTRTHPDWERIGELANEYGQMYYDNTQEIAQKFAEWRDHAIGTH